MTGSTSRNPAIPAMAAVLVAAGTYAGFRGGIWLDFQIGDAWPFWLSTGVTLAALLWRPTKEWPLYLAAAVIGESLVIYTGVDGNWTTPVIAVGNAAEALVAGAIIRRFSPGKFSLQSVRRVAVFVGASVVSAPVAATVAFVALETHGYEFSGIDWVKFWVGGVLGLITVSPGLFGLAATARGYAHIRGRRLVEALAVLALSVSALALVFVVEDINGFQIHGYVAIPVMALIAYRFGTTGVSATGLVLGLAAVAFTAQGHGPFAADGRSPDERVAQVQLFVAFTTVPMLFLAAGLTQRRRLQTERAELRTRLEQSQRLDAMGRLASTMAHDFNNLLQVVTTSAQLAEQGLPEGHAARGDLADIRSSTQHAGQMIRQTLAVFRQEPQPAGKSNPGDVLDSLKPLLLRMLSPAAKLKLEVEPDGPDIAVDRVALERLIVNLVANARDSLEGREGVIAIRAGAGPGGDYVLSVEDTGCGMPEAVSSRIWEPFFTTKPAGRGTGLGLASVYGLVTGAGGNVRVDSAVGRGTTFTLTFPTS